MKVWGKWAVIVLIVNLLAIAGEYLLGIGYRASKVEVLLWMNLVFVLEIYGGHDR